MSYSPRELPTSAERIATGRADRPDRDESNFPRGNVFAQRIDSGRLSRRLAPGHAVVVVNCGDDSSGLGAKLLSSIT
jgi:hypothetical protein